ncbi:MAG TPA: cupin domain-containing protein [Candidatus Binatia bacterium]|nr:cupin domain-containing protein [Candidatus Binatia bacterium]
MSASHDHDQDHVERLSLYALRALPADEVADIEAHVAACPECREALVRLRAVVASLVAWPTDVLRPPAPLWDRLAQRIGVETGAPPVSRSTPEPDWENVAPGISVKLLATDPDNRRVTMLVRLAPGTDYPPHRHAGIEELHLLDGELRIDDRELHPGDYSRAEPGTVDQRVWSATGCTCLLVTSPDDLLR